MKARALVWSLVWVVLAAVHVGAQGLPTSTLSGRVKAGDQVRFRVEKIGEIYTVTVIERAR